MKYFNEFIFKFFERFRLESRYAGNYRKIKSLERQLFVYLCILNIQYIYLRLEYDFFKNNLFSKNVFKYISEAFLVI